MVVAETIVGHNIRLRVFEVVSTVRMLRNGVQRYNQQQLRGLLCPLYVADAYLRRHMRSCIAGATPPIGGGAYNNYVVLLISVEVGTVGGEQ